MLNLLSRILYLTFLILVIIGISKLYLPLSENDYERILNNDKIVIGIRTGPASYYEIKNQKIGFTYELVRELSQYLNIDLKIITIDSIEEAINDLDKRKIDMLVDVGLIERKGLI